MSTLAKVDVQAALDSHKLAKPGRFPVSSTRTLFIPAASLCGLFELSLSAAGLLAVQSFESEQGDKLQMVHNQCSNIEDTCRCPSASSQWVVGV